MMLLSDDQIEEYLKEQRNFAECILEHVQWQHYGTIIDLVFDYIWRADGTVRPEYVPPVLKTLRCHVVQEMRVLNGLSVDTSLRPDALNWGLSEVASVRLVHDDSSLDKYRYLPVPLHHLRCLWEGARQIDVVFSTLEVL